MMVSVVSNSDTLKSVCPTCNKEVEAIKLSYEKQLAPKSYVIYNYIHILGCPECNNVFFNVEINPILKKVQK